jgi:hypothetical protein
MSGWDHVVVAVPGAAGADEPWPWDEPMKGPEPGQKTPSELERYALYEVQDQPEPWRNGHQHPCPGFYANGPRRMVCGCRFRRPT